MKKTAVPSKDRLLSPKRAGSRRAAIAAGVISILVLAVLAWTARGRLLRPHGAPSVAPSPSISVDPTEARLREAVSRQPRNAVAHVELGRYLLSMARPASALWELQAARSLGPGDVSLPLDHARALVDAGQRPLAIVELRALLKEHPAEAPARIRLAELLLETGQPAEAATLLHDPLKGGDAAEAAVLLGRADHALGHWPEAETAFRRYARLAPSGAARFQPLGRFLLATGRPDGARRVLMQDQRVAFRTAEFHYLLGLTYLHAQPRADLGKAGAAFTVALRFDPNHALARAALGEVLEQQGARAQAVAQYEAAIQCDPVRPEPHERDSTLLRTMGQVVPALQQRGIAATLEDQLPEAERAFGQMLKADPTDLSAIQSYILTCVAMKRVDRSRPAVEALQRLPFDPATADRVARLYLITGTRAPVRHLAEEWRRQQAQAAGPLLLLGRLAVDDLRVSEGIHFYEQAWAIGPQDADTAASLGLAWRRVPSRPNLERAAGWLQRAVALAPSDPRNHNSLAEVERQLDRLNEAREEYLRALDLDPSLAAAWNGMSRVALSLGQPAQAGMFGGIVRVLDGASREEERLRRRAWEAPDDAQARVALARFLLRAGQLEKARSHLDAALKLRPGWELVQSLRRSVESLLAWS